MTAYGVIFKALAGTSAGALFLGYLGIIKPLRYAGRMAAYVVCIVIAASYGVLLSAVLAPLGKRRMVQHYVARFFYVLCGWTLGLRAKIENESILRDTRPAMIISNHQSMLDIFMLGAFFPPWCSVTAKKALKYYPFLGWFMWASGSIFINRTSRTNALQAFEEAKQDVLKNKQSVFMFPEGTRSHYYKPGMLPFKKGAFHFAIQCQIPIVPIVVSNYSNIWSQPRKIIESGTILVKVLDPVPTKGLTGADVNDLLAQVRQSMESSAETLGFSILKSRPGAAEKSKN